MRYKVIVLMFVHRLRKIPPQLPAVFSLGVASQVGQVVLLRELLMVFYGSELSIGVILASWMFWVGIGSWLGTYVGERVTRPMMFSACAAAGILVLLPATVFVVRVLRGFFDVAPGEYLPFLSTAFASVVLMMPVCLLLGLQFVMLSRLWRELAGARDTSGAAKTYLFEAGGNAFGGALFTLLLVRYFNPFQLALAVGMLMLAATGLLAARRSGRREASVCRGLTLLLAGAALSFPFLGTLDSWAYRVQWRLFAPDQELVETRASKYGTISVVRRRDQYSFFQSGHLAFSTAEAGTEAFEMEESAASVFAHFALVQHKAPKRVLLIGGGMSGVLREMLRHPVEAVDYVELDRVLMDAAGRYMPDETRAALANKRVSVVHRDGRLFVKEARNRYDLIVIDLPDPATAVLNRFYTLEFFREANSLLNAGGVFVLGVTSTADLRGSAVVNRNATVYHTLRAAFAHVLPVGDRFCYFFASNAPDQISADPEVLRSRFVERGIDTQVFSEWFYHTLLEDAPLRRRVWVLMNHGRRAGSHRIPPETGPLLPDSVAEQAAREHELPPVQKRHFINSDFRPIGYYYTLVLWNTVSGRRQAGAFNWVSDLQGWWLGPIVGAFLLVQLFLRALARRTGSRADAHLAVLFAIFTTGLATMALQVALLFAFQSIYGFVYEMVGLIVAFFMAGLGLGAAATQRRARGGPNVRLFALIQLLIAGFAFAVALGLPSVARVGASEASFLLFAAITFCGGLLNGAGFPLAAACCLALTRRPEKSTGIAYGTELLGACSGALLAGASIAPVLGIVACCLLAAIMNTMAFLLLALSRAQSWTGGVPQESR